MLRLTILHRSQERNERPSNGWMMYEARKSASARLTDMGGRFPLTFHGGLERQWARCMKSLGRIRGQLVAATERTLLTAFNGKDHLFQSRSEQSRTRLDRGGHMSIFQNTRHAVRFWGHDSAIAIEASFFINDALFFHAVGRDFDLSQQDGGLQP